MRNRPLVVAATVAAGLGLALPAGAVDEPAQARLVKSGTNAAGQNVKVWSVDGHQVRAVGSTDPHLVSARVTEKTEDTPGTAAVRVGFESDPTEDVSVAQARENARSDGNPRTTAPAEQQLAASTAPQSWCVYQNVSGDDVHTKTCNVRITDFARNGNQWYNDSVTGSAWSTDGTGDLEVECFDCDRIEKYGSYLSYEAGNEIPRWDPNSTVDRGSCKTVTVGVTSPKTGIGYTESRSVCPDKLSPWRIGELSTGAIWTGPPAPIGDYRGLVYTAMDHSPRGVGTLTYLHAYVYWD